MKVVYYFNDSLGHCPVKEYLRTSSLTAKTLHEIRSKVDHICDHNGNPVPPIALPVKEFGMIEIRQGKDEITLIRIMYFCKDGLMILLHAFEKPRKYEGKRQKGRIDEEYQLAQIYKKNFIEKPDNFDPYV